MGISIVLLMFAVPEQARMQDIQTATQVSPPRIAPGESMPVSVKLTNFGSSARTDVVVTYAVVSSDGTIVSTENETYAVETTASFLHTLTLSSDIRPGQYSVKVSIAYTDQKSPAVASYPFTVERKVVGIFLSDLVLYGLIAFAAAALMLGSVWLVRRKRGSEISEDYSDVPRGVRVYYEIIGDTIRAMRAHEGDKALSMVAEIPGLTVNADTGHVLHITGEPASVVAALIAGYEKQFGKRINLAFGKNSQERATVR
jgi:hypothetical protein